MREYLTDTTATENRLHAAPTQDLRNGEGCFPSFQDSLPHLTNRMPSRNGAREHAVALNRATGSRPSLADGSVLQLQRHYGNRYVQRVLALARQGNGEAEVTPEIESTIERTRGGGQGLDHGVRREMESAFGSDFGGVRVHTGGESHELNKSVNAVAFTTGRDIFFSDGAYSPGSTEGKELLAHELTHVVQQGGSTPISGRAQRLQIQRMCPACEEEKKKSIQGKLVVGQPDDAYEREADRVAKEMAGTPETIQRQVNPQPSPQAPNTPLAPANARPVPAATGTTPAPRAGTPATQGGKASALQSFPGGFIRFVPTVRRVDASGNDGPEAVISNPDQTINLGTVTNGDHGSIKFKIDADWDFENPGIGLQPAKGQARIMTLTPFRVPQDVKDDDDKLKFSTTRFPLQFSGGTGASLDKQPAASADPDDRGGSVTVTPSITYQVQLANQVQGGFNVTVLFLSEAFQVANQAAVNEVESISRSYTASLTYKGPEKPKLVPPYDCKQAFGPFVVASDRFMKEDDARQQIHDWYFGLDAHVRADLEAGKGSLRITGRASTTGTKTLDLSLAEKRAKRVSGIIADFAGSNAHLNTFALGEFAAQTPANTEDPNERRVDVEANGQVAEMQGDGCTGHLNEATTPGSTGPVTPADNTTQPIAPGTATPGPQAAAPQPVASQATEAQAAGPQNEEVASSSVAAAPTGNVGTTSGTTAGPQNFEEPQPVPGETGEIGQDQTAQATTTPEEQQGQETAA